MPCNGVKGITPYSGDKLTCFLSEGDTGSNSNNSPAGLMITNFKELPAGTEVKIMLANIDSGQRAWENYQVTILLYSAIQRIYYEMNRKTITLKRTYYDDNVNLPPYNGRSPATYNGGDGKNIAVFDSNEVNKSTEMLFIVWPDYALAAGSCLLVKVPTNYPLTLNGVTCFKDYTALIPCYTFPEVGWVFFNSFGVLHRHVEYTFQVKGLTNPPHRIPA
jgi:hypothetical protein